MTTELNLAAQLDLKRLDPALRAAAAGLDVLDFDAASLHEPMLEPDASRSRREFARAPGLSGGAMDRGWAHYLADAPSSNRGIPAHRPNLEGLPAAFISCAKIGPCRDEAVGYAIRLFQACVHTELHVFAPAFHGFDSAAPQWAISREVLTLHARSLDRAFSY